tara:strand:+ start:572 stop:1261 length:690 start_codon:yes stop_codon:yes gene_type:complete
MIEEFKKYNRKILLNLKNLQTDIAKISKINNRNLNQIKLMLVTKTLSKEKIIITLNSGYKLFGENRVQESKKKWPELKKKYNNIELHLIGALQRNKVKEAVALFDVIETLDRFSLVESLSQEEKRLNKKLEYFIQINTGNERQKAGVFANESKEFIEECLKKYDLNVSGLMCIPPQSEKPEEHFEYLQNLARIFHIKKLSMGMSNDYETAIKCGSTQIRIGSKIFGARD